MAAFTRCLLLAAGLLVLSLAAVADQLPPQLTYRALPTRPFDAVRTADEAEKPAVEQRQRAVLEERYDLSDRPIPSVMMSGGRKSVQGGARVEAGAGHAGRPLPLGGGRSRTASVAPEKLGPVGGEPVRRLARGQVRHASGAVRIAVAPHPRQRTARCRAVAVVPGCPLGGSSPELHQSGVHRTGGSLFRFPTRLLLHR